jgi:beta-glucanase (GH16 family)
MSNLKRDKGRSVFKVKVTNSKYLNYSKYFILATNLKYKNMKIFIPVVFLILISACQTKKDLKNGDTKKLVWADEFDYNGLPDSTKWNYEEGLIRNDEAQYYTKARLKNARVENGLLTITAHKEDFEGSSYTSASINTKGKFEFTRGRVEVRAKLPEGRGTWPAIWTLGTNIDEVGWPACGEIDIMEFVGYDSNKVYANVHTRDYNHSIGTGRGGSITVDKPFADFHIYAVDWHADSLNFYFDNTNYYTCVSKKEGIGEWPFTEPQYLLINLAIGGAWGGTNGINDAIFPVEYQIDYVRIYELE